MPTKEQMEMYPDLRPSQGQFAQYGGAVPYPHYQIPFHAGGMDMLPGRTNIIERELVRQHAWLAGIFARAARHKAVRRTESNSGAGKLRAENRKLRRKLYWQKVCRSKSDRR